MIHSFQYRKRQNTWAAMFSEYFIPEPWNVSELSYVYNTIYNLFEIHITTN